jgi:hypothetical protein
MWWALFACEEPIRPSPADYDATCVASTDCALAVQPSVCGGLTCDVTTCLSTSGVAQLEADDAVFMDEYDCDLFTLGLCPEPPLPTCDCVDATCAKVDSTG